MPVRKIVHTLCGVVLLGVLATSAIGAMTASRTTYFTFSGTVQMPGVVLPAGTYVFEVVNPNGRLRRRQSNEPRSEEAVSHAAHAHRVSSAEGQSRCDHRTRGISLRQPSSSESVVSAKRDPRPRVHLLTTNPIPAVPDTCSGAAGQPLSLPAVSKQRKTKRAQLLVAQSFNRIQSRGADGGVHPEDNANGGGKTNSQREGP